jgi:hypothetical protein
VSVLFDAPQSEVRCLLVGPKGVLYAGTASDSGGGSGRGLITFSNGTSTAAAPHGARAEEAARTPAQATPKSQPARKDDERPAPTGTASPRPVSPGENAVYRIEPDGAVREVFRAKALVFALSLREGSLLIGTGPEGQLYQSGGPGDETFPLARLDTGHILSLLAEPTGGMLLGTADPGSVVRLEAEHVPSGTLLSEVKDTKLISRFGAVTWRANCPDGTSVRVQVRTGNVAEPDATWSDWSPDQTDPSASRALVPAGRFAQYRATLATSNPRVTPELTSVTLRYQTVNLSPEIAKLDVPDISTLDGSTRQTRITIKWDASDPNDDELAYAVFLRKDGWPDWVQLNEQPVTEKSFTWDTTAVPSGSYRVRVTASDRPSNNPADALQARRMSDAFLVDHDPPKVSIRKSTPGRLSVTLHDGLTRVARAAYAVDGGDWEPVFADDGLFDSQDESVTVDVSRLKPGVHVVMVRATDAAGNVGSDDTVVEIR